MVTKELAHVYICSDGKRFLLKKQADKHERELEDNNNDYKIFNN